MTRKDNPPVVGNRGAVRSDGQSTGAEGSTGTVLWPACLSDEDLVRLVRQLDGAVRAVVELPDVDHDLIHAAALARLELRRRRARRRVAEMRRVLAEAGWSP